MYSNEQIKQLSFPNNHTIKYDGYDYWWFSKVDYKWQLHTLKCFKSHLEALSFIKYWVTQYSIIDEKNNKVYSKMINKVMDEVRIYDIVKSKTNTLEKITSILDINPYLNQTELSEYLNITKMAISKQLKKINKFTK